MCFRNTPLDYRRARRITSVTLLSLANSLMLCSTHQKQLRIEQLSTVEQRTGGWANLVVHFVRMVWMLMTAMLAVAVGFATLNMVLTDSGFAVLSEHSPMLTAFLARVTRQA